MQCSRLLDCHSWPIAGPDGSFIDTLPMRTWDQSFALEDDLAQDLHRRRPAREEQSGESESFLGPVRVR